MSLKVTHTIAGLKKKFGGPSVNVSKLAQYQAQRGAKIQIVFGNDGSKESELILPERGVVNIFSTKIKKGHCGQLQNYLQFKRTLKNVCHAEQSALVHDHGLWLPNNHASAVVAKEVGIPLVISPRGMLEPWSLTFKKWKKKFAWYLYQYRDITSAAAVCATSHDEAEHIRQLGIMLPIAVVPNGVELPLTMRPKDYLTSRTRNALFISRIHPKKGLLNLIEAWRRVRPAGWNLLIAGHDEDGYERKIRNAVKVANIEEEVHFLGPLDGIEKETAFSRADIVILPTFSENFGVVVAEALAAEVPVITTKGAPWSDLEKERCGWWIDIGVEPLCAALVEATNLSDEQRRSMGARGAIFVKNKLSWDRISQDMLLFYQWVLKVEDRPAFVRLD